MSEPQPPSIKQFSARKTGALSLLKYTGVAVIFAGLLGAVAVLLIYPLWYIATQHKEVYSTIIAFSFSPLIFLFVLRARRALRNGLFAEFILRVTGVLAFFLFLCTQVCWTLLQTVLYSLIRSEEAAAAPILVLVLAAGLAAFACLVFLLLLRRNKIWGRPVFIFSGILFTLHIHYWIAVYVYNDFWLPPAGLAIAILGFFFLTKLTKIKREKQNPTNETIHH